MGEVENKPSAIRYGLVCLPSISLLSAIMLYCNIDIIPSLYNVYNDSIMYNHGIVYILQAAFLSAYILNAVVSYFVHLILPEAAANSIFPLSLAFILAPGIDKSYLRYGYAL